MLEVIENKEIAKRNPKLFHFGVKSKVGALPLNVNLQIKELLC
jgi:hypothetical protein